MVFSYQEYLSKEFWYPVFLIAILFPMFVVGVKILLKVLIRKRSVLGLIIGLISVGVVSYILMMLENTVLYRLFSFFIILFVGVLIVDWMENDNGLLDEKPRLRFAYGLFRGMVLIILSLVIIFSSVHILRNGSVFLPLEKELEAECVGGVIEKTEEMSFLKRGYPDIENNSGLGESLIINDKRYYVMTYGNYRIGDKVRVFFLPKSKYVLKIEKAN